MADERVVAVKLEQIEQYHGELKQKQESLSRTEFLESTTEQRAVERMFENAIQACSDLAQHITTRAFSRERGERMARPTRSARRSAIPDDVSAHGESGGSKQRSRFGARAAGAANESE